MNRAGARTRGPTVTLLPPLPAAPKIQTWWRGQWRTLGPGDDSAGDAGTGGRGGRGDGGEGSRTPLWDCRPPAPAQRPPSRACPAASLARLACPELFIGAVGSERARGYCGSARAVVVLPDRRRWESACLDKYPLLHRSLGPHLPLPSQLGRLAGWDQTLAPPPP